MISNSSVKNLAILSEDSYNVGSEDEQVDTEKNLSRIKQNNFSIIKKFNNGDGFQAKAYKNNDTGEIIIAYAGTNSLKDLQADAKLASGVKPSQLDEAIAFYKDTKAELLKDGLNSKITLTGHSLGGMLAIQVVLNDYNERLDFMGGVTKENFLKMKSLPDIPEAVVFESPAIIMSSEYNNQIYSENKKLLGLFGYTCSNLKAPGLMSPLSYQPTKDSLDVHLLGITSYQNTYSLLTRASGLQVGVINLIDAPLYQQHGIHEISNNLDNNIPIKFDYQNIYVRKKVLDEWMKDDINTINHHKNRDPLILDLKNDGIKKAYLPQSNSYFNLNNYNDYAPKVEWIISNSDDGFLCIDKNQNGTIDNGNELFTEGQLLSNGKLSQNGVEVLKDMDTNHDNVVDENDEGFDKLLFWNDINNDGISQKEEIHTLKDVGVKSFALKDTWRNYTEGRLSNGKKFVGRDYDFIDNKADSIPLQSNNTPLDFNNLTNVPYIPHIGFVDDLWTASSKNSKINTLFKEFHEAAYDKQNAILDNILYEWAGTVDIADIKERNASTTSAFGTLSERDSKSEHLSREKLSALRDMLRVMDFMQSDLGADILDAYQKDMADTNAKGYENVKQKIIDIAKNSAHDGNMAMEAFYGMVYKKDYPSSVFYDETKSEDLREFKYSTIFIGDDNFKTTETNDRGTVKNIYFDKTINTDTLDLRQISGSYNMEIKNKITGESFVIRDFGRDNKKREKNFVFSDGTIWDKETLEKKYVCKPADINDNSRLVTENYSDIHQTIVGNTQNNDILASRHTTVVWGIGDGFDTVSFPNSGSKDVDIHIQLKGLNRDDIFFRREQGKYIGEDNDLYIVQKDSGKKLKLQNFFDSTRKTIPTDLIFADGSKLNLSEILAQKDFIPVVQKSALNTNLSVYKNNVNINTSLLDVKSYNGLENKSNSSSNTNSEILPSKAAFYMPSYQPYNQLSQIDIAKV